MAKLTIETAVRMYNSGDDAIKAFALEYYTESELIESKYPKSWEDLKTFGGYYITTTAEWCRTDKCEASRGNTNVFAYKDQALASIAMAQLSQLMRVYNENWRPDWDQGDQRKYIIATKGTSYYIYNETVTVNFLAFKSLKIARLFLKNFEYLIKEAKPLL